MVRQRLTTPCSHLSGERLRGEDLPRRLFVIRKTWYPAGDRRRKQALRRRQRRRTPSPPEGMAEGVIALAIARYQTRKPGRRRHLDLDVTPLPVGHEVRRRVADRILAAQLQSDLLEILAHLLGGAGEKRFSAGRGSEFIHHSPALAARQERADQDGVY